LDILTLQILLLNNDQIYKKIQIVLSSHKINFKLLNAAIVSILCKRGIWQAVPV